MKNQSVKQKTSTVIRFLAPFVLLFFFLTVLPIIASFLFSFLEIGDSFTFVGLENYREVFKDNMFTMSYINVFIIMLFSIPITIFLALLFAVLLNLPHLKGKGFFRTVYYIPTVTSIVAIASVFLTFYNPTGLFNSILTGLGLSPIPWLQSPFWARVSIIVISIWLNVGYYTVLFLGGLQSIGKEVYESADIDGASKIRQFFSITIPLLKPVILLAIVLSTINGLGAFQVPNILFKNGYGPERSAVTVGVNLYKTSFEMVEFGKASAIAWTMVFISFIVSMIQIKMAGDEYEQ